MNKTTANNPETAQRFVRWILLTLIVCTLLAVLSLATDIASFSSHTDHSGNVTAVNHHTTTSRVILSLVTLFHVFLILGLMRRAHNAWRAAFALPVAWALVVAVINWPQLAGASPDWLATIPVAIIIGVGTWQTIVWSREWVLCESLFNDRNA